MGYSPWDHKESDTPKHTHVQGLLGNLPLLQYMHSFSSFPDRIKHFPYFLLVSSVG